jgi:hypothetical protein
MPDRLPAAATLAPDLPALLRLAPIRMPAHRNAPRDRGGADMTPINVTVRRADVRRVFALIGDGKRTAGIQALGEMLWASEDDDVRKLGDLLADYAQYITDNYEAA